MHLETQMPLFLLRSKLSDILLLLKNITSRLLILARMDGEERQANQNPIQYILVLRNLCTGNGVFMEKIWPKTKGNGTTMKDAEYSVVPMLHGCLVHLPCFYKKNKEMVTKVKKEIYMDLGVVLFNSMA